MQFNFNVPFAVVALLLGCIFGSALRDARRLRKYLALLLASIVAVEFGFLVTGTRKVESLLFLSSALGLLATATLPTAKLVASLAYWISLGAAVYYFAACLLEATSGGVGFTFGSLLGPILVFGPSLLIYISLRFVLAREFVQPLLNRVRPFRSDVSFGLSVGTALGLFYIIPMMQGFVAGLGLLSVALVVVEYTYCLWVLVKGLLPGNKPMLALWLALGFALTLLSVGETVDPAFNTGRLVGMAVIGFGARSVGISWWPKTTGTALVWMSFWYLVVSVVLAGRLEPGSPLYPGGFYEANWSMLVASIGALAFGFGVSPLVTTSPVAAPSAAMSAD